MTENNSAWSIVQALAALDGTDSRSRADTINGLIRKAKRALQTGDLASCITMSESSSSNGPCQQDRTQWSGNVTLSDLDRKLFVDVAKWDRDHPEPCVQISLEVDVHGPVVYIATPYHHGDAVQVSCDGRKVSATQPGAFDKALVVRQEADLNRIFATA